MNWKLLFTRMYATCVVLLVTGDCSALGVNDWQPAADHAALMLDSGLWRSEFLTKVSNTRASEVDAPLSAQPEPQLSSGLVTRQVSESPLSDFAEAPGNSLIVEMPVVGLAEFMLPDSSADLPERGNDTEAAAGDTTLSDWQQAAAVSVGRKGRTLNSNGPSLISLVVGVVGLIVIVGAYMTSGKKQH